MKMDYDDDILLQDAPGDNVDDLDVCIDETVVSKDFEYLLSKDTPEVDSFYVMLWIPGRMIISRTLI